MDLKYLNKIINSSNLKTTKLNDLFFSNFCTEKFNGTRKLILNGNDLFPKIGKRIEDDDIYNLTAFLKKNSDINSLSLAYNYIHCQGFIRLINYLIVILIFVN
ncbi:GSCOCG00002135001-RA-CDS, partial [Cotesia congregata]